jgi:hypothetical protein
MDEASVMDDEIKYLRYGQSLVPKVIFVLLCFSKIC